MNSENLVVSHFLGGKLAKGIAPDFNQKRFLCQVPGGNSGYQDQVFPEEEIKLLTGMKLKILFRDGELMYAPTLGNSPARSFFWSRPLDSFGNNERLYVNMTATVSVEVLR